MALVAPRPEIRSAMADLFHGRAWRRIAFFLLPYAAFLCGLDIARRYADLIGSELPKRFLLSADRGIGEYLEYSLTAASAILLLLLYLRRGRGLFLTHAAMLSYLTLDNAYSLHERFGMAVADRMPQSAALQPHHLGEIFLLALVGLAWLALLAHGLPRADTRERIHGLAIAATILAAAVFGVGADALASLAGQGELPVALFSWLDDFGEFTMIIAAFLVTCAVYDEEAATAAASATAASYRAVAKG